MIRTERIDIIVSEQGSRVVKRNLDEIGETAQRNDNIMQRWMQRVKENFGLLAAGAVAAGAALSGVGFALFEQKLKSTGIAAEASGAQLDELGRKIRQVSLDYGQMAFMTAGGAEEMAKAGVTATQMLDGALEQAQIFATATGGEFEQAAGVAANAMKVFGFEAKDLSKVVQGGAAVINLTTHDLNDYRHAVANAGFMAKTAGVSFDDFNAVLAASAAGFSSGATQGTALKTFLLRLSPTTKEASKVFRDLKINFREADGAMMSMDKVAEHLRDRLGNLSEAQRQAALQTMFGIDAFQIADNLISVGGETIRKYRDEIIPMTDANEQARIHTEGLAGAFMYLLAAANEFAIRVMESGWGDAFGQILRGLGNGLLGLADLLKAIEPLVVAVGVAFAVHWGGRAWNSLILTGAAVDTVKSKLIALYGVLAANPLAALIGGLVLAGTLLYKFRDDIKVTQDRTVSLGDVSGAVWDTIKEKSKDTLEGIDKGLKYLEEQFPKTWKAIEDSSNALWNTILEGLKSLVNKAIGLFGGMGLAAAMVLASIAQRDFKDLGKKAAEAFKAGFNADYLGALMDDVMVKARARAANRTTTPQSQYDMSSLFGNGGAVPDPTGLGEYDVNKLNESETREGILRKAQREIDNNTAALKLNNREREVQNQLFSLNEQLRSVDSTLSAKELEQWREKYAVLQRETEITQYKDQLTNQLVEAQRPLILQQEALNRLLQDGAITQDIYNREMEKNRASLLQLKIDQGNGNFTDGFMNGLNKMLEGVKQFRSNAGAAFSDLFSSMTDGFANSVGRAIMYSENLGTALGDVARSAVAQLIGALVKLGIQWLLNATLGQTIAKFITASSMIMGQMTAQAWAPAAAMVSLATLGANAAPASAAIVATTALASGSAILGFADGGYVSGPGSSRSDSIPARLSNGEYVVNAAATRRNFGALQAINSGKSVGNNITVAAPITIQISGDAKEEDGAKAGRAAAREFEAGVLAILKREKRFGGVLS